MRTNARCQVKTGYFVVNTSAKIGQFEPAIAQLIDNSTQRLIQAFAQAFPVW
ncbi:hypothetical protein [Nostoc sp. CCY0012]|uniref:hypothetical protein n=1 Tax=Nostoc sp. CCY0012 TaxID=1056123 RepID=UPI0039C7027F